jgi:hypothetical protein
MCRVSPGERPGLPRHSGKPTLARLRISVLKLGRTRRDRSPSKSTPYNNYVDFLKPA